MFSDDDLAATHVPAGAVGARPEFTDPLWRVRVRLNPVESALLRTEPLRRLHFVVHGGASALTTLQSYSRLEHTLGVLALVAHFRPTDAALRVAALLHDVGHLPLSHTFEGLAGLDHHAIGLRLLDGDPIRPVLAEHGIRPDAVTAALAEHPPAGLLSLDHLDSFVRSGRSGGWLETDPAALLRRLTLVGHAVSADAREDAAALVALVCAEARLHTSWNSVGPSAVVRGLAGRLLADSPVTPEQLARMTDHQFWSALDACAATRAETARLHYEPHRLRVTPEPGGGFALRKLYRSAPLLERRPLDESAPELSAELGALDGLPLEFRVSWSG
ncbi:HD domain-containing protein [Kitasatospora viridis]|nr:HD domain-containing protein [Kitasatospora viridis]